MKTKNLLALIVLSTIIVLSSCRKDKDIEVDSSTQSSTDNGAAENIFLDIKKVVEEAADDEGQTAKFGNEGKAYTFGACATVSTVPAWGNPTFPKTMTIDFGATNCTGYNGVNRRGQLIVTITDHYRNAGSVLTVQPQNLYINDVRVDGTKSLTNNGYNSNNHLEYAVQVSNALLTYTDGTTLSWNSTRTNEWIAGDSTTLFTHGIPGICDDIYLVSGSANGVNRNGLQYTVNITSPLRKEICCRWVSSGAMDIIPQGFATRTVDFGAGACDNDATVTINGNTYNVQMW
jgi:hypothetical protein